MVIIAGERSGVGKTTVTLALLAALQRRASVQSFKVGPDYIDPMFHQAVTGRPCRNLDPVLTSEAYVQSCFNQHSHSADYVVVEGVMGLFDGASGSNDWASTAHIARLLNRPIVLVLDCSRLSRSIAAVVQGYRSFDPRLQFAGIILNRVGSDRHLELLKAALESSLPILGILRRQDNITIPDRHLGLIPTAELPQFPALIDRLTDLAQSAFNWNLLLSHLSPPASLAASAVLSSSFSCSFPSSPRIAVAYDRAFSFYYPDNFEQLQQAGAELVFWSPLQDSLPDSIHGLYFGGGFPEVFAEALSQNTAARTAVRSAIAAGMPTYAECGGLMYLAEALIDFAGQSWPMVGVLPTVAQMGQRLTLGYRRAQVEASPFLTQGCTIWGHEFHRSTLTQLPQAPLYRMQGFDPQSVWQKEGWQQQQLHASYLHLHWGDRPEIPAQFVACCDRFAQIQP